MTKSDFLRILEVELAMPKGSLDEQQALADVPGWDSMAAVQFIALADEKLGINIPDNDLASAKTVRDLLSLLGERLTV